MKQNYLEISFKCKTSRSFCKSFVPKNKNVLFSKKILFFNIRTTAFSPFLGILR